MGRFADGADLLRDTWRLCPGQVLGAALLLRGRNVVILGKLQKSLVRLLGLPWQLGICSFVFLENYAGLLIARFAKPFFRGW